LAIARQLGWTDGHQNHLAYGSILHDIGKIHIMEDVLSKPGPLNDEEWDEMKKHTIIGAEMVKNITYLLPAIPIIRNHHERWDGTGYPDGLAGEEIPMAARIVAVADSLDAMITSRTYRNALTPDEAYEEIVRCTGTHFDPDVVRAFEHAWEQIRPSMV
jgi:putative nucleotidyltransferase with HDIG domain